MLSMLCDGITDKGAEARMIRTYRFLQKLKTFEERYQYLRLKGTIGEITFGYDRYFNQILYKSQQWRSTRDIVIIRDNACDLGMEDYEIRGRIIIHHMNPITLEDIELGRPEVFDPKYLICTTIDTHNAIHFGDESLLPKMPIERKRNDTCPWLK